MTNTTFEQSMALRQAVAAAVNEGVFSPNGVKKYLIENGWKFNIPSRQTIEKLLRDNGVTFIEGYWTKK